MTIDKAENGYIIYGNYNTTYMYVFHTWEETVDWLKNNPPKSNEATE